MTNYILMDRETEETYEEEARSPEAAVHEVAKRIFDENHFDESEEVELGVREEEEDTWQIFVVTMERTFSAVRRGTADVDSDDDEVEELEEDD